jgi:Ca2+/Na+ antiporter
MIVLFSVVTILIRLITCVYAKEKIIFYKEIKSLIYIIYTFALFKLISTSDFSSYSNNFILFKEIMRYDVTSSLFYRNVIGNILLFIPFGYMITDMLKQQVGKCNIFIAGLVTTVTSLSTEVIQMFIGRSFDIDDIFLNFVGGIIGLKIGGDIVVDKACEIATIYGISKRVIGLTIVAIGTALPELITSIIATIRKEECLATGNLIGSCILNSFFILGIGAIITPLTFLSEFINNTLLLAFSTLLIWLFSSFGKKCITRWNGIVLLTIFSVYMISLFK